MTPVDSPHLLTDFAELPGDAKLVVECERAGDRRVFVAVPIEAFRRSPQLLARVWRQVRFVIRRRDELREKTDDVQLESLLMSATARPS